MELGRIILLHIDLGIINVISSAMQFHFITGLHYLNKLSGVGHASSVYLKEDTFEERI